MGNVVVAWMANKSQQALLSKENFIWVSITRGQCHQLCYLKSHLKLFFFLNMDLKQCFLCHVFPWNLLMLEPQVGTGAMYLGQQFAKNCIWVVLIAADNSLFCPLIHLPSGNPSRIIALLLKYEKDLEEH